MDHIHPLVRGLHRCWTKVINMFQTPIFSMNKKKMLKVVDCKMIYVRKLTSDTKCATITITITALGKTFTLLIIFKGALKSKIKREEFSTYPTDMLYQMQHNAWMDERVMIVWVENMLKPYFELMPENIIPFFLDSYRCHIMGSIVNAIRKLGCKVQHIPG